jgi:hypothetical protein
MGFIQGAELISDSRSKFQDCHDNMYNKMLQEKWISNILPGSIVLDNPCYHTVKESKVPYQHFL